MYEAIFKIFRQCSSWILETTQRQNCTTDKKTKIKLKTTTLMLLTSLFRSRTANLAFTRLASLFLNVSGITRGYDFI